MPSSINERKPYQIEPSQFSPKPPTLQKFITEGPLAGKVEVFNSGNLRIHADAQELEKRGQLDLTPEDAFLYHWHLQLVHGPDQELAE